MGVHNVDKNNALVGTNGRWEWELFETSDEKSHICVGTIFERERKKLYLHMQFDCLWQKAACTLPYAERTKESFLLCLLFEVQALSTRRFKLWSTYVEVESFTNETDGVYLLKFNNNERNTHSRIFKTYMNYTNYTFAIFLWNIL